MMKRLTRRLLTAPAVVGEDEHDAIDLALPPLDADERDEAIDEGDDGDDETPAVGERDDLDDAAASDLEVGDDLDEIDDDSIDDHDREVDVGALDDGILVPEDGPDDAAPDFDVSSESTFTLADETHEAADGGAEGTNENPEDSVDETALPELDDGEDSASDADLAATLLAIGESNGGCSAPRVVVDGAGALLPCACVVASGGRVAAAGDILLVIDEGDAVARPVPLDETVVAVALVDETLVAMTGRGQLLASRDLGATFTTLAQGPHRGGGVVELAATPGRLWVRVGATLSCTSLSNGLVPVRERRVAGIAVSQGTLVAVTLDGAGPALERVRGDDESPRETRLYGPVRALVERAREGLLIAANANGQCIALGDSNGLAVSRDAGATFASSTPGSILALAFAGDDHEASLLGLVVPDGATSAWILEWRSEGPPAVVGTVAGIERGRRAGLCWDQAREVIWVAASTGLAAFGLPRTH